MSLNRRELLISAIAVSVGLGAAHTAHGAGDAMTMDKARDIIGDRYKNFDLSPDDSFLTPSQMRDLVSGNTVYGVLHDDKAYVLAFHADGRGKLKINGRPSEEGRWWIDEKTKTIDSQWPRANGGQAIPNHYWATGEPNLYWAARTFVKPPENTFSRSLYGMFVLRDGLHLDF